MRPDTPHANRNLATGGVLLALSAALFLITIGFEAAIGWLDRDPEIPVAVAMQAIWSSLEYVWFYQMIAMGGVSAAGLILLTDDRGACRTWYFKVAWAVITIGALMATAGFSISLKAYPTALADYATNPGRFDTLRATVKGLYGTGINAVLLGLVAVTLIEGVRKRGMVPRAVLAGLLVLVLIAVGVAKAGLAAVMTAAGVVFLFPMALGLGYWQSRYRH